MIITRAATDAIVFNTRIFGCKYTEVFVTEFSTKLAKIYHI